MGAKIIDFTREECERIYLQERWPRTKFETAYPDVSWQSFLYYVKKYDLPTRAKYTPNDELLQTPLTADERDILTGSLLGDGTLILQRSYGSVWFYMAHSTKQATYLEWKRNQLTRIIPQAEPILQTHVHNGQRLGETLLYRSLAIRELREWEADWYLRFEGTVRRKKIVPAKYLDYLTAKGLAIWYMDDGSYANGSATLHTNAYNSDDLDTLRLYLANKWGLATKLHKSRITKSGEQSYIIAFGKLNTEILVDTIRPYVPTSMLYKLGMNTGSVETKRCAPERDDVIVRAA